MRFQSISFPLPTLFPSLFPSFLPSLNSNQHAVSCTYLKYTVLIHVYTCNVCLLSCVRLFKTHGLQPTRLLCPWDSPGKNIRMGCHFLLQGISPTQGSNLHLLCLLHCRQIFFTTEPLGKPIYPQNLHQNRGS